MNCLSYETFPGLCLLSWRPLMNKKQQGARRTCFSCLKFIAAWFLLITASSAVGEEIPDLRPVIEAHGYIYDERVSWIEITQLTSGAYLLMVLLERPKEQKHDKYVIVVVDGDSVVPIHEPQWLTSIYNFRIHLVDINGDGKDDLDIRGYYEFDLYVEVFFGLGENRFRKVFEGNSASRPEFVELGLGDLKIKELILSVDPYNAVLDPLYEPRLYVFNGDKYVLAEP